MHDRMRGSRSQSGSALGGPAVHWKCGGGGGTRDCCAWLEFSWDASDGRAAVAPRVHPAACAFTPAAQYYPVHLGQRASCSWDSVALSRTMPLWALRRCAVRLAFFWKVLRQPDTGHLLEGGSCTSNE